MSLSRRGFFQGVLGLVAGLVGSRVIGSPPLVNAAPSLPAQAKPVDAAEGFRFLPVLPYAELEPLAHGTLTISPTSHIAVSRTPLSVEQLRRVSAMLIENARTGSHA